MTRQTGETIAQQGNKKGEKERQEETEKGHGKEEQQIKKTM